MSGLGESSLVAWASEEAVPEVRQQSHDELIYLLGDRRRGGVSWRVFRGLPAHQFLDSLIAATTDPTLLASYDQVRGFLREYGGVVVVASAMAVAP